MILFKYKARMSVFLVLIFPYQFGIAKETGPSSIPFEIQVIGGPVTPKIIDVDLRDLPKAPRWRVGDPIKEIPRRFFPAQDEITELYNFTQDPLAELQKATIPNKNRAFTTTLLNFSGQGFTGASPPDTVGDIGKDYYIQSVNGQNGSEFVVYNKADGTIAAGPIVMDTLGSGSCAGGAGDPIVLYDQQAERWFLQEFSGGGNFMCFYISQTDDPVTGGWFAYGFAATSFPDYPHFGIWPDAYYGTANQNSAVYAFDRTNMLAGATANPIVVFHLDALPGYGFQTPTPADWDGATSPPAGSPGIIMRHIDEEAHSSFTNNPTTDLLEMYTFDVDFVTPANSMVNQLPSIVIADFNSWFTNYTTFFSVPQPGGGGLDPIREVILNRLQYRNFGTHETLVGVLPTNIDPATSGTAVNAGLRWFELQRSGGAWFLQQEGTFDPGVASQNRFVGSLAMDQSGNMAMGYSFTDVDAGNSVFPSLKYTGRMSSDVLGVMTQGETDISTGSSPGGGRWGDYAAMGVDPVDDCTFWFTSEYQPGNWATQITSFKFDACGCELTLDTVTASAANNGDNDIQVTWNDSSVPEMIEYLVFRSTTPGGGFQPIATINDTSLGMGSMGSYSYDDTDVSGGTVYYYIVRASDGGACLSGPSNEVSEMALGMCTLAPVFGGVSSVVNNMTSTCSLDVNWSSAISQCTGGGANYDVFRSLSSGFTPDMSNQIASGVLANNVTDTGALLPETPYFYVVRSVDLVSGLSDTNTLEAQAIATGPLVLGSLLSDDLEAYTDIGDAVIAGWGHNAESGTDDWRIETGDDNTTGTGASFVSTDVPSPSSKWVMTQEFAAGPTSILSFWHKFNFEAGWDGGVLEITTDGGSSWLDLDAQITSGGYTTVMQGASPLSFAWSDIQGTFTEVIVDLNSFNGQNVRVRWRMATDSSVGAGDWKVDDIQITDVGLATACSFSVVVFEDGFESL